MYALHCFVHPFFSLSSSCVPALPLYHCFIHPFFPLSLLWSPGPIAYTVLPSLSCGHQAPLLIPFFPLSLMVTRPRPPGAAEARHPPPQHRPVEGPRVRGIGSMHLFLPFEPQ